METKTMINTIMEESDDIIYLSDPDTYEIVYMNKAARHICGISTDSSIVPVKKCYELFRGRIPPAVFATPISYPRMNFTLGSFQVQSLKNSFYQKQS